MRRNLSHIIAAAFNEPLLLEPAYARVFFCALGREMGAASLSVPQQQVQLDAPGMLAETDEYMAGGKRPARVYRVVNGIAVLPMSGTLVHRLGGMRPFSGMTGYDGIVACLQQAMADSQVRGILLDIDSPGGQAAGAFDCADMIYRLRQQKPVWALCNDTACSAAMLLASACSRRLVTQTSRIGSIGVMMSHVSYAGHLAQAGVDITLIYAGAHKVDGNQFEALPAEVRQDMQQRIDAAHRMFAEKVAMYTGLSVDAVTGTEAAVFEGQSGIEAGLADELINASDAISVMATALNSNVRGGTMPQLTATEAAVQENQRVMGILTCQEAKGREQLATMLAGQQGMSVEQARAILAAAAPQQPVASAQSEADRIMACEEANGREQLAVTLAAMPEMTVEKARPILAASPQANAGPSLRDQIMALDEAKGAEAQAEQLAACPGMTVESARAVLAAGSGTGSAGDHTHGNGIRWPGGGGSALAFYDGGGFTYVQDSQYQVSPGTSSRRSYYQRIQTQSAGAHTHSLSGTAASSGAHAHTVGIGAHTHSVAIGSHGHTITVNAAGNAENTVKNIAFNYIVRLA
ncbi:peptidase S49 family protein [Escherichia coli 7-233-03_S3_C1]|uniref:S49 family peptidase n=1 Tax=Escherichia coli TaxID=562 RepID=UPI0004DA893B|nr:S49 family peptidase [Escherichia coli]KEM76751.1 peptidase S49 family protein [Escherichia coli 7-233-03_S3_C1]